MATTPKIAVQHDDYNSAAELAAITEGRNDIGAVVSFSGLCRDEGGQLATLELEHYPGMAEKKLQDIANLAATRWPLQAMTIIHRFGKIEPGENIVLVIAASSHRQAAFEAADFVMDFLKTDAPFWKKEHRKDGSAENWVEAKQSDDVRHLRWKND